MVIIGMKLIFLAQDKVPIQTHYTNDINRDSVLLIGWCITIINLFLIH